MERLKRPHPLIRLALFGGLTICGWFGAGTLVYVLYLGAAAATGGDLSAVAAGFEGGSLPLGLTLAYTWLGLALSVGLAAAFHAWGGEHPLAGLRSSAGVFVRDSAIGLALGLLSMGAIAAVYFTFGWSAWQAAPDGSPVLPALALTAAALAPAAAIEEVVFRGYVLRTLEQWRGWLLGAAASSALFGLAHAGNPSVSVLPLINIGLAGGAFALAYRATGGRLWLPIAYHFMWNYAQGPLFGFPVSGLRDFQAGLTATMTGPALWTGGAFGPEGGLVMTGLLVVTCAGIWAWERAT